MTFAITSDLHVDYLQNENILHKIIEDVDNLNPKYFCICGDISHKVELIRNTFRELSFLNTNVLFVPGNHDVWVSRDSNADSKTKYNDLLPELCYKYNIVPIWKTPIINKDISICGTMGWYDYSFRKKNSRFSTEDFEKKAYKRNVWNDKRFIKWNNHISDRAITDELNQSLNDQLDKAKNSKKIIVMTHHLPFSELIRWDKVGNWDYFVAFFGNDDMGNIIRKYRNVKYIFSGHVHIHRKEKISGIEVIISSVGYPKEWAKKRDADEHQKKSLEIIEIV